MNFNYRITTRRNSVVGVSGIDIVEQQCEVEICTVRSATVYYHGCDHLKMISKLIHTILLLIVRACTGTDQPVHKQYWYRFYTALASVVRHSLRSRHLFVFFFCLYVPTVHSRDNTNCVVLLSDCRSTGSEMGVQNRPHFFLLTKTSTKKCQRTLTFHHHSTTNVY